MSQVVAMMKNVDVVVQNAVNNRIFFRNFLGFVNNSIGELMKIEYIYATNNKTYLFFESGKYNYQLPLKNYLNNLCYQYGTSLKGSIDSFNFYVAAIQKTPIVISICDELIFYSVESINQREVFLFNYFQIDKLRCENSQETLIIFKSGNTLKIDSDIRLFKRQIKRIKAYLTYREKSTYLTNLLCYNIKG